MNKLTKLIALFLIVFMLPVFAADQTPIDSPSADQSQTESGNTDTSIDPNEPTEPSDPTESTDPTEPTAEDYANEIIAYYSLNPELSSWWDIVALYGAGADLEDYTLPEWTAESLNENSSVTDYAGIIFGLIASGENVHDIWERDIADELAKMQDAETGLFGSYPNQQIYSMLALDAAKEPYNRDAALSALIDNFRAENGAFGYLPWDPSAEPVISPDIDITAMALLVLDSEIHSEIITSAVDYLAESQLENGGYSSWGTENSNTLETVIWGLSSHNLLSDARFIKNDRTLTDILGEYVLDNGMLEFEANSGESNLMATQQGLIAFGDIINGKNVFLRLSSEEVCSEKTATVRIEGSATNVLDTSVKVKCYNPNVLDAIKVALDLKNVPYIIEDSEYGAYIESINSEAAGKFGGWDGWLVVLNGEPMTSSADAVELTENDEILVYYGMFAPETLVPEYTISTNDFKQKYAFSITVTGTYFDYTSSQEITVPIVGATVDVGGHLFITDSDGVASVSASSSGENEIKIYKNNENSYPSIVRIRPFTINVEPVYSGGGGSYRPSKNDKDEKDPSSDNESSSIETESNDKENTDVSDDSFTDTPSETPTPEAPVLSDMSDVSDWALQSVERAVEKGLFYGDENGRFNPGNSLTRAELAILILRFSGTEETEQVISTNFADISPDDWYYSAICNAFAAEFMTGSSENTFSPSETVTREQLAVVIARALKLQPSKEIVFEDTDEISPWAQSSVSSLAETGIMIGSDNNFNPKGLLTREMCAVVMIRALDFIDAQ